jgi:phage gp45-like
MNWNLADALRRLRTELKFYVQQRVASSIRFAQVSLNSATGYDDAVQGHQTTEEEQPGGYQYQVRRLWPFGIRSRPPAGVDAAVVHAFGGSTNGMMVGAESPQYGPDDLEDGETAIYSSVNASVLLADEDGNTAITSATDGDVTIDAHGTGETVVNGGTARVARDNDPCDISGALATWMGQVETAINFLSPGAVAPLSTTFLTNPGIAINGGAARFKA